jgi:hypothetical protein
LVALSWWQRQAGHRLISDAPARYLPCTLNQSKWYQCNCAPELYTSRGSIFSGIVHVLPHATNNKNETAEIAESPVSSACSAPSAVIFGGEIFRNISYGKSVFTKLERFSDQYSANCLFAAESSQADSLRYSKRN